MGTIFFFVLAAVSVISAILIVAQRNPVASALFLIVTLCSQAMLYLLLGASFLAVIQIIVYAGAIMVLFLFVIMLLNLRRDEFGPDKKRVQRALALALGGVWLIQLVLITKLSLSNKGLGQVTPPSALETGSVQAIGKSLFTEYLYPFEITSILLLVAILGSIVLAKKENLMVPLSYYLILSGILFSIGVVGVLISRNAIVIFMAIEVMLNAVSLTLVAFSQQTGSPAGQVFVFLVMTIAAAEAAVGLAIIIVIFRSRESVNVDEVNLMKW